MTRKERHVTATTTTKQNLKRSRFILFSNPKGHGNFLPLESTYATCAKQGALQYL
jgi:hypothetical protein